MPVIAYDRLIRDAPVDYYVSVDGIKIGELQGDWLSDNTKDGARIAVINGSPIDDNAHLFAKGYMASSSRCSIRAAASKSPMSGRPCGIHQRRRRRWIRSSPRTITA